jgi:hypothetical protein
VSEALTVVEGGLVPGFQTLEECERVIEHGRKAWRATGLALFAIQSNSNWYVEAGYQTFEAYMLGRWQYSRPYGYHLMDASRIAQAVSPMGDTIPTERVARELVRLLPRSTEVTSKGRAPRPALRKVDVERVTKVLREAERRVGPKLTAAAVREVVQEQIGPKPESKEKRWICYACSGRGYVFDDKSRTRYGKPRTPDYHGPRRKALM